MFCKIVILNGLRVNSSPDWGYGLIGKSPVISGLFLISNLIVAGWRKLFCNWILLVLLELSGFGA
jgi:hypothetical protein